MDFFTHLEIVTRYLRGDRTGISFTQFLSAVFACGKALADNFGSRTQQEPFTEESLALTEDLSAQSDSDLADKLEEVIPEGLEGQAALDPALVSMLWPVLLEVLRRFLSK